MSSLAAQVDKPLVSVVMPVYNGQRHLRQALDSALAQTYANLEVIVVNDGSTDGSAQIIASYGPRLVSVEQQNMGVAGARNTGMKKAQGQIIAFLDQDDWWAAEKIQKQVDLFLADDRVGLVHTAGRRFDQWKSAFTGPMIPGAHPELLVGDCYRRLLMRNSMCNSSVAVRASVLEEVGLCDPAIPGNTVQDYDLWLRIARRSRFAFVPEPLTVFRVHSAQGQQAWGAVLAEEAHLMERTIAREGLARRKAIRRRMASLYDELGTTQMDCGGLRPARRSFARSLGWKWTRRAALLWVVCWLPSSVIRRLQRLRSRQPGDDDPQQEPPAEITTK